MLHNTNNRYEQDDNQWLIPVSDQTFVFTVLNLNLPAGVPSCDNVNLFQGNIDAAEIHAKTWLKSKRGIKCSRAGGFISEYNFRFFEEKENFGDAFVNLIRDLYHENFE